MTDEEIRREVFGGYLNKFKNRLYGLLCEKEKGGEWEKFLDNLLTELLGFPEPSRSINYYILYFKLSSLKYLEYSYFRKTIFESMNLVDHIGDINGIF